MNHESQAQQGARVKNVKHTLFADNRTRWFKGHYKKELHIWYPILKQTDYKKQKQKQNSIEYQRP